jgi:YgiT-type zinc finger domain-containing protein
MAFAFESARNCLTCGGEKMPGVTTFTADTGDGVVVIHNVPATVCSQCGADWLDDATAARIEETVEEARKRHSQVEVLAYV